MARVHFYSTFNMELKMIFWILSALGLYFVQTLLPVVFRYKGSPDAMKSRDVLPETTLLTGRADRLAGVAFLRTAAWLAGLVGLFIMAMSIIG